MDLNNLTKIEDITTCPFCGGNITPDNGTFHCEECGDIPEDEARREILRQRISLFCFDFDATEDNPTICDSDQTTMLTISGYDEMAQGLSSLQKPRISKIYSDYEGILWIEVDGNTMELADITLIESYNDILLWLADEYNTIKEMRDETDKTL